VERPRDMPVKIQVLACDMHNNVPG